VTKSEANAAELLSAMERLDLEWQDRVKHEKADKREFEEVIHPHHFSIPMIVIF
jgi:hypothetical protein